MRSPSPERMSSQVVASPAGNAADPVQNQQAGSDRVTGQGSNSTDQLISACSRLEGPTPACEQMLRSTATLLARQGPPYTLDWATRIAPHLTINNLAVKQPLARITQSPYFTVSRRADDTAHATVTLKPDDVLAKYRAQETSTTNAAQLSGQLASLSISRAAAGSSNDAGAADNTPTAEQLHVDSEQLAAACTLLPGSTSSTELMIRAAASYLAAQGSPYQSDWATQLAPHLTLTGMNVKQPLNKLQASSFFKITRREHDLTHATIQLLPEAVLRQAAIAPTGPPAPAAAASNPNAGTAATPDTSNSSGARNEQDAPMLLSADDLATACNALDGATPDITRMLRSTATLLAGQGPPYALDWATRIAPHLTINNLAVKQPLARITQSPYFTVSRRADDTAHATVALKPDAVLAKRAGRQQSAASSSAATVGAFTTTAGGDIAVPAPIDKERLLDACNSLPGSSNAVTQLIRTAATYLAAQDYPYEADWATELARHFTMNGISVKQPLSKLQASSFFKITRREHDLTHATIQLISDRVLRESNRPAAAYEPEEGFGDTAGL